MGQLDIEDVLTKLTLDEKIGLLAGADNWHTMGVPRLGIPRLRVSDGPNGIRGIRFFESTPSNCFPCGTALAATFNKQVLRKVGQLMGQEAKIKGAHIILGPTCNILRSPVGGRSFESYSEDPLLSGYAAANIVNGIQSENIVACLKHFVCNDQEDGRFKVDTLVTERALREIYLKPFEIAIRESNPQALMTAYNKINGTHVSQDKKILLDILRQEWKYSGATMSDWFGTYSTKDALDAGLNLEMPGPAKFRNVEVVKHMVACNEINQDVIDDNVRKMLVLINHALESGVEENAIEGFNDSQESKELLRLAGNESIVLLKNNGVLPLKNSDKLAVIGPNADACRYSGGGSASLNAGYTVTPLQGIKNKCSDVEYTIGAELDKNLPDVGDLGQFQGKFYDKPASDDSRQLLDEKSFATSKLHLSDYINENLTGNLFFLDIEGSFTPDISGDYNFGCATFGTAQIFVDNKLLVDNKTKQTAGDAYFLGVGTKEERGQLYLEKGQKYTIRVEFGSAPTYTLPIPYDDKGGVFFGWSRVLNPQEEIQKAVEIAKNVDKVILVVGISKEWESEGFDRPNMDIPGYTNQLIKEVCKVNKQVVVVNQSGSPVTMPWINEIQGLVHAWYGGNETGNTIADVLFGDVNPSGKLSVTFPVKFEHNPSYINFGCMNGQVLYGEDVYVGYRYYEMIDREVLFPFGYGLSYTTFGFTNLKVTSDKQHVAIEVDVTNNGEIAGSETVQVYINQANPSITRPKKELKDFNKISLSPGESKTVKLEISLKEATSYWNTYKNQWISEKDTFNVLVGNSSDNIVLQDTFETDQTYYWLGL